ncbi:MAG: thioesterase domain-containing protein [Pseudomonadota bacterium]|nr:thioesterase domain-containing protein [Pseudomonadota bacterium]
MFDPPFGKHYLQDRITSEFALARHLGIVVERADEHGIVLCAPLGANANGQGTAFGGSLFSVAVLAGWAWVTRYLDAAQLGGDAVIQESTIRYLVPVHAELRATLVPPTATHVEKFRNMLRRAGRGRIQLEVRIHEGNRLASVFEGVFVAALR